MKKFRITHISNNGDKVTFEPKGIKLLDYKALIKTKNENKTDLEFKIFTDKSILNDKHLKKGYNTVTISGWTPHQEQTMYALTIGGWLPFSFIDESDPIMLDRNVIDRIKKIVAGKNNDVLVSTDWWLRPYRNSELTINSLLYAMEGSKRKTPNFQEFCESLHEAEKAIIAYSDKFKIVSYSKELREEVFQNIVQTFHLSMKKEIKFLSEIMPLIWKTQSKKKLHKLEKVINDKAIVHSIYGRLSHLAVLDILYEDTSSGVKSHGRGLLKPQEIYTEEDAYNALSDLLNLEILLHFSRENDKVYFCTADFHLAAFWVGLNINNVTYSKGRFTMGFTNENLFSRADSFSL
jgi:hypothetical protein